MLTVWRMVLANMHGLEWQDRHPRIPCFWDFQPYMVLYLSLGTFASNNFLTSPPGRGQPPWCLALESGTIGGKGLAKTFSITIHGREIAGRCFDTFHCCLSFPDTKRHISIIRASPDTSNHFQVQRFACDVQFYPFDRFMALLACMLDWLIKALLSGGSGPLDNTIPHHITQLQPYDR
jgi:hypothetical protein